MDEAVSESTQQIGIGHIGQVHYLADDNIIENNTATEKHLQEETIYIPDNSDKLLHRHLVTSNFGKQLLGEKHRLISYFSCFESLWVGVVICAQPYHHRSDFTVYLVGWECL